MITDYTLLMWHSLVPIIVLTLTYSSSSASFASMTAVAAAAAFRSLIVPTHSVHLISTNRACGPFPGVPIQPPDLASSSSAAQASFALAACLALACARSPVSSTRIARVAAWPAPPLF